MANIEKLVGSESRLELGQKINEIIEGKADYSELETNINSLTTTVNAAFTRPKGFATWYDVGSGWVAPTDGLVYVQSYSNSKGAVGAAYINGLQIYYNAQSGSNANHHVIAIAVPIYKGQTFTYSGLEVARFYQYSY